MNGHSAYTNGFHSEVKLMKGMNGHAMTEDAPSLVNGTSGMITTQQALKLRKSYLAPACSVFYPSDPILVTNSFGQYVVDEHGRQYLDCISNVQHVGHGNPQIAKAVYDQMLQTTCNSRFLHPNILRLSERLRETLPAELSKFFYVNSGSEANDLAVRLAEDITGGTDIVVIDHAYHGHLTSTIRMSPYKFNGTGGAGLPQGAPYIHIAPCPDVYRGKYRLPDADLANVEKLEEMAELYASEVASIIRDIKASGRRLMMLIIESLQSCGGQVIIPPGYMKRVIGHVHEAGGLFVTDEVQSGYGRCGERFWAFQMQGITPDIVTMGKPMGNGFPIAGVATHRYIADGFCKAGMEYFNTYGGNPVSCTAALEVLNVMEADKLIENARQVGSHFLTLLKQLQSEFEIIGDVRGMGLFIGLDLVCSKESRDPLDKATVKSIVHGVKSKGVLLNNEGPHGNIIKIKPPMCFTKDNAEEVCNSLKSVLLELGLGSHCSNGSDSAAPSDSPQISNGIGH